RPPPRPTLFPYTTLFRSLGVSPPILVWGAGAIGGSIGAALIRAGQDVLFVDRDAAHVEALNARGLEIVGPLAPCRVSAVARLPEDRKSTRLNSSHDQISY